jgi:hypothetical protein
MSLRRKYAIVVAVSVTVVLATSYSGQFPFFGSPAYKAPLTHAHDPNRIYGTYMVMVQDNYAFEQHIARIGTQEHVTFRLRKSGNPDEFIGSYGAEKVGDGLLAAIRADPGVQEVICDREREFVWE